MKKALPYLTLIIAYADFFFLSYIGRVYIGIYDILLRGAPIPRFSEFVVFLSQFFLNYFMALTIILLVLAYPTHLLIKAIQRKSTDFGFYLSLAILCALLLWNALWFYALTLPLMSVDVGLTG